MTQEYAQEWHFNNGRTMERMKFYDNDKSALAGTISSFKRSKPEAGEKVVLFCGTDEVGCIVASNSHVLLTQGTAVRPGR